MSTDNLDDSYSRLSLDRPENHAVNCRSIFLDEFDCVLDPRPDRCDCALSILRNTPLYTEWATVCIDVDGVWRYFKVWESEEKARRVAHLTGDSVLSRQASTWIVST